VASELKKFAVFDIDGTLIRWQLYHAVADELARRGRFGAIEYEAVRQARMTWKKRKSEDSFKEYERALVNLVDQAISGVNVQEWQDACQTVIEEYKEQVYTYTRDLLVRLRRENYLLFAISASEKSVVKLLAEHYGFTDFAASTYEVVNGKFTGTKDILRRERKPEALTQLANKYRATYTGSVAVGDSENDIPMLEAVEQPIAFNPTKLLFEHAKTQGWQIILERKNVVYKLGIENDKYQLQN